MCPIYTKTFGGKIWCNLHSVSPYNFLVKKFKMASLKIYRQKSFEHHLVRKIKMKRQFVSCFVKKEIKKYIATSLLEEIKFERNKSLLNILVFYSSARDDVW